MNLSKNSRKTQKAIRRALMLGLPIAGLLATAGCERKAVLKCEEIKQVNEMPYDGPMGKVAYPQDEKDAGLGRDFGTK